ncbi:hypothetical protein DEJ36_13315 [Curtobacterium sp. MCPF17_052]|nr:hypothetical protein [Curtobacterium sp. MCPF17_052]WIB11849.1 hypothetical protein DEJ36_13315 [Curtobacterium sp. MCPF17_052]
MTHVGLPTAICPTASPRHAVVPDRQHRHRVRVLVRDEQVPGNPGEVAGPGSPGRRCPDDPEPVVGRVEHHDLVAATDGDGDQAALVDLDVAEE